MENLTEREKAVLAEEFDKKFITGRLDSLRRQVPVVEVYPRQMFLPSGTWCSIFNFKVPVSMAEAIKFGGMPCRMHEFTILGAPGGMYSQEERFSNTYYQDFDIRGAELVQPFRVVDALNRFGGGVEVQCEDVGPYEGMSQMTLSERAEMVKRVAGAIEGNRREALQAARVYGVLHTIREAQKLIRCAAHDAEDVDAALRGGI